MCIKKSGNLAILDEITMTTNSFVYQNAESGDAKVQFSLKTVFSKEERSSATVTFSTESAFVPFVLGFLTLVLRGENRRILNSGLNIITVRNPEVNILFDTLRNQKIGNAVFISISDPFNLIARGGFEPSTPRV